MASNATFGGNEATSREPEVFQFTLVLKGNELFITGELENALFDAGCDDATLSSVDGEVTLEFDRAGESLETAVRSAILDVEECGQGIVVVAVHPPYAAEFESINQSLRDRRKTS